MTNKPTWGEQYEKEIVPEIRKSVVNYSRFANSNRNASYDAYEALTKGNSLVSDNHTADLQYKLKQFISTKLAEQRKQLEEEIKLLKTHITTICQHCGEKETYDNEDGKCRRCWENMHDEEKDTAGIEIKTVSVDEVINLIKQ